MNDRVHYRLIIPNTNEARLHLLDAIIATKAIIQDFSPTPEAIRALILLDPAQEPLFLSLSHPTSFAYLSPTFVDLSGNLQSLFLSPDIELYNRSQQNSFDVRVSTNLDLPLGPRVSLQISYNNHLHEDVTRYCSPQTFDDTLASSKEEARRLREAFALGKSSACSSSTEPIPSTPNRDVP
jgi:hypothetical protein